MKLLVKAILKTKATYISIHHKKIHDETANLQQKICNVLKYQNILDSPNWYLRPSNTLEIRKMPNYISQHPKSCLSTYYLCLYLSKSLILSHTFIILRGNYQGFKLLDQVMKIAEQILNSIIRDSVDTDSSQIKVKPERRTTDAIFIFH